MALLSFLEISTRNYIMDTTNIPVTSVTSLQNAPNVYITTEPVATIIPAAQETVKADMIVPAQGGEEGIEADVVS